MLVVLVSHSILLFYLILNNRGESVVIYATTLLCFFGFLLETLLGQHEWLISDEYSYYFDYKYWTNDTRFLWGYVNKWFHEYDIYGIFLLFNIPFLIYSISLLSRIFKTSPIKIVTFSPYVDIGIANLRDILILTALLRFILLTSNKIYIKTISSVLILYGTRLFALYLLCSVSQYRENVYYLCL